MFCGIFFFVKDRRLIFPFFMYLRASSEMKMKNVLGLGSSRLIMHLILLNRNIPGRGKGDQHLEIFFI